MRRCFYCFKNFDSELDVCPFCGRGYTDVPVEPVHLVPGTILFNRYVIGLAVGSGGFGIVYRAWDMKLETVIAIKEFYVSRLVYRAEGTKKVIINKKNFDEFEYRKRRFLVEAQIMAKFGSHRSIPNVFEFFEENNTAYIVMELLNGVTLSEYLHQTGGKIDTNFAVKIANEVSAALKTLHERNIIHRDVAPDNIFICTGKDIRIKLMDLGAAQLKDSTDDVIDIILKPGYSPPEQYDKTKNIGPWSDIYALGATLYMMLTGVKPDESTNRKITDEVATVIELNSDISENLNNTIMKSMAIETHMRFKNIDEFVKALNGEKKILSLPKERKKRKRRKIYSVIAASLIVVVCIGTVRYYYKYKNESASFPSSTKIEIWFPVETDDKDKLNDENNWPHNLGKVKKDFVDSFGKNDAKFEFCPCLSSEYSEKIAKAAETNSLPDIFESTDISDELIKSNCVSLDYVVKNSKNFKSFSEDYYSFYQNKTKMPLAIEFQNCDKQGNVIVNEDGSINCDFTYEWSVTKSNDSKASQILLKHMLDDELNDICYDMVPVCSNAFNEDNQQLKKYRDYKDKYEDFVF